ncbi:hypothetical protein GFS31_43840 (plasmid) [Leptolyngbya sp. BL0902]|nr:hypothetical protein GFS31_43840 [Leptolyngbya sp. BL0902]
MDWSATPSEDIAMADLFQSLRGFGVDWSKGTANGPIKYAWFQSLRGFGVDWSSRIASTCQLPQWVSIPERVWGGLEPHLDLIVRWQLVVSIPERVWGGLEPFFGRSIHWAWLCFNP